MRALLAAFLAAAMTGPAPTRGTALAEDAKQKSPGKKEKATPPNAEIAKLLAAFQKEPNRENFVGLRAAVVAAPSYSPYSFDLDEIGDLAKKEQFAEVQTRLKAAMPNLLLSPRAHLLASRAAERLGDARTAEKERSLIAACFKGILSTGDGSREKPYLVTRVSDEYDVLGYLKKRSKQQAIVRVGDKQLDRFDCTDGSVCCFDVTEVFGSLMRRAPQK
jgi:hypothetical protein